MCGHPKNIKGSEWVKERPTECGYYAYAQFFSCGCLVFGGFLDVYEGYLPESEDCCLIYHESDREHRGRSGKVSDLPDHSWYFKISVPKEVYDD